MPTESFYVDVSSFGYSRAAVARAVHKASLEVHEPPFKPLAKVKLRPNVPSELRPYAKLPGIWQGYLGEYSHVRFGAVKHIVTVKTSLLLPRR